MTLQTGSNASWKLVTAAQEMTNMQIIHMMLSKYHGVIANTYIWGLAEVNERHLTRDKILVMQFLVIERDCPTQSSRCSEASVASLNQASSRRLEVVRERAAGQ